MDDTTTQNPMHTPMMPASDKPGSSYQMVLHGNLGQSSGSVPSRSSHTARRIAFCRLQLCVQTGLPSTSTHGSHLCFGWSLLSRLDVFFSSSCPLSDATHIFCISHAVAFLPPMKAGMESIADSQQLSLSAAASSDPIPPAKPNPVLLSASRTPVAKHCRNALCADELSLASSSTNAGGMTRCGASGSTSSIPPATSPRSSSSGTPPRSRKSSYSHAFMSTGPDAPISSTGVTSAPLNRALSDAHTPLLHEDGGLVPDVSDRSESPTHATTAFASQPNLAGSPGAIDAQSTRSVLSPAPTLLFGDTIHRSGPRSMRRRCCTGPRMSSSEYGSAASTKSSTSITVLLRPLSSQYL